MSLPTDFPSCSACGPGRTLMGRHTCWRRETDSESAEEPPPTEQQHTTDNQPKGPGSVKGGGHLFEMKMAALIGLRGLQRGDNFQLFSNRNDAGNFDDLVYTAGGRRYFLQLEHADNVDKKKLTKEELVTLLQKCYKPYWYIKHSKEFRDISIDNTEFIIYTNRELGPELLKHDRQQREIDMILKTSDKGEIFNFAPDNNKEIDVYTLVENSVKNTIEFRDLCDREMVKEFLKKLIVATGQKGRGKLDEVIKEEIRKRDAEIVDDDVYSAELLVFKEWVEAWCRNTKEKMTATMFRNWLQEAKTASCTPVVSTLFVSCAKKLARTGITFSDCEISRLQAELSNKRAVHLRSDALTLCSILLLDCLPQSKCIFVNFESLQSNKKQVFHAWLGGHWEWLIVSCDTTVQPYDISKTCREIRKYTTPAHSKKYFIILTHYSVQEMQFFTFIHHRFKFEQLSDESQAMVLDKKIDFQGCEVTMRSVLQQHGNVEHVLGPELVTDLITEETAVNIGGKLHVNTGYYAPRVLERKVWLYTAVLWNEKERFAISGAKEKDVLKIVPSAKTFEFDSRVHINATDFTQDMTSRIFLLPDEDVEDSFLAICEKLVGKSLHWVEFNNGVLTWKMSQGGTDSLLEYVDAKKTCADMRIIAECMKSGRCEVNEELIWDLGERTVLVFAEPGMGKSSTTTHVAWHTKLAYPTSWVLRINWYDHTRELQEINSATFSLDTLVEFLCSAAFPDSKYTDIIRSLLKQALQCSGNVTVLMDGFDEISPIYADKAVVIVSELTKTKVRRVWVTSLPVEENRLEKELSVIAYGMRKLSRKSQEDMLYVLWKPKEGQEESKLLEFIKTLLWRLNDLLHDKNFTGCPLYITMIATVYEMEVERCLNSIDWIEPRIDLINLYEKSVERKLHIYLEEKQKTDITNSSVLDDHKVSKQGLLMNFEKCALAAILPPHMLKSLHDKKIEKDVQLFSDRVEKGKDKTGIVMNVVEGMPQFVHRTFAEYFTARWFSKNFETNRSVLELILFDRRYRVMKDMFDRMMTEDCPLHCAVLEGDIERCRNLLEEGFDVNAVDKGGRTVMHIIATHHSIFWDITNFVFHCGVSLDNTDCVLQWTPLKYAIKSEEWYIVEELLERNVDRSDLDMIMQRAHDTDYIDPIIIHAAKYGHILLLEFLFSTGVNIQKESYSKFHYILRGAVERMQPMLDIARWIRLEYSRLPREIDSVSFYETCVESKLREEKVDITNYSVLDNHKLLQKFLLEDFERCALVATLPSHMLESLHNKKIQEQTQPFLGWIQAAKDKTGIVMNVVEGKPQFVHRTFAEYFTARWFSKNFESNRSVMELILFDREYRVVRVMFDRMMTKGCPLHCAVLNWDKKSVKTLLKEGCDVNAVDKGGRTVMHIIATHHSSFWNTTNLLFHCGVPLDNKDCVLQWTPLQYAINSEYWVFVEWLLRRNVDRSGLDMIRQRANNEEYIDKVIYTAAECGHILLLEFIRSMGVNIHQVSSVRCSGAVGMFSEMHVVKWQITRDRDGQTSLSHLEIIGSLTPFRRYVNIGVALPDVRDDYVKTAFDCVRYRLSLLLRGRFCGKLEENCKLSAGKRM